MRILITGGTGLIGRALCRYWRAQGHDLWVWSRTPQRVSDLCSGARGVAHLAELETVGPFDAVVNLAGAPIADRPWTTARRDLLWRSRVGLTRDLVDWLGRQAQRPEVLVSTSAVGWYGDRGDQVLDESSAPGLSDFGSRLCVAWEQEADRAQQWGMRVVLVRTAPVLASEGGMLPRLLPAFRWGLGGRLGHGQQWMPWIHLDDQVRLIDHLLRSADCRGAFNACAPGVVRNQAFTQALGRALRRPTCLPVPGIALKLALGEMSVLLLGGQHLVPRNTLGSGFDFQFSGLDEALATLV